MPHGPSRSGSVREPLISHRQTTHGRCPVCCPIRPDDTEVAWLVQAGGVVVRESPGNAVVRRQAVAQAMKEAGRRISPWNGGRDHGFLGDRLIRYGQRGGQADDKRPCQGCTSGEISRSADLRGVAGANRARGLSHPDRSTSGSVHSSCESLPADRRFLFRNLIQTASITLAPKKLIRTRRASEGSASEPSLARRVSMC